jgi:hypothetical protein
MEAKRNSYMILVGKPEGKRPLEDLDIDGRIIWKWILEEQHGGMAWIPLAQDRDQ